MSGVIPPIQLQFISECRRLPYLTQFQSDSLFSVTFLLTVNVES